MYIVADNKFGFWKVTGTFQGPGSAERAKAWAEPASRIFKLRKWEIFSKLQTGMKLPKRYLRAR